MTNKQISQILKEISGMLEIKGENSFKVLAYEKAARLIKGLTEDLDDIYNRGGVKELSKIKGIGEGIAEKIEELVKKRKSSYYLKLKKEVPAGAVEIMKIPGLGAKTAKKLYDKLKIKGIEDLKKKALKGGVSKLDNFSKTTEENILRGIKSLKKHSKEGKRMLLSEALPIAEEIIDFLKKEKQVKNCDMVGSLRRWRETIGDIDIVVAGKSSEKIIEYFKTYPKIKKVLLSGPTKISIQHKENIRVDIEVLETGRYGSLLHHLTGSKHHNVALRTWAEKRKLKISEYGITDLKKNKEHIFADEKEFFKLLGMQYIEPELREDAGEIEAAFKNKIPKLVQEKDIKGDLHVHTNASDGHHPLEDVVDKAIEKGYKYVGISDHTIGLGVANGLSEERLARQIKKIEKLNKKLKGKIRILTGAEINIKANGDLDLPNRILEKLDILIASVHTAFNQSEEKMTERIIKAIKNPHVKMIGHPSGRIIGRRGECEIEWPQIFKAAKEYNVALEINSFPNRLDLRDVYIREAIRSGCKLVINTDSHELEHFEYMRYGVHTARRGWAQKKDIINTMTLEKLLKYLGNKHI